MHIMRIIVIPKIAADSICAEFIETKEKFGVISINAEDEEKFPEYRESTSLLKLVFADIKTKEKGLKLFDESQAISILNFVSGNKDRLNYLFCQCLAGRSRSAGVAAAISKIVYGDDSTFFKRYTPNSFVYKTILETNNKFNLLKGESTCLLG